MKKFFRLIKYFFLGIVFVVFAFFRWILGGQSNDLDHKKLSNDDLKNSLPNFPEANADVSGDDDAPPPPPGDDGGDGDGDDGDGGC